MKVRINYIPWKITVQRPYRADRVEDRVQIPGENYNSGEGSVSQQILAAIKKWRRFPCSAGDGADSETVYVLLDRIQSPFALLDVKYTQVARASRIKGSELPSELRSLYSRLCDLGHADPNAGPEGGEK